ncbi:membrane protein [Legionella norrlandica]|uniref:Membrane protein n=1 Tax=Legionella norrlandica TaxID=1498499 RepID=A0A0A2SMY3_9GAMM|nr:YetF domain-containing protein [Legionella norrlandica]KGP62470.1 membrane protein [Legionella norrlandica]
MLTYYLNKINSDPNILYILIRTFITYVFAISAIRVANTRFNFKTPFDYIFIIVIGAVLSRAINGTSTLFSALAGSSLLIFLHWLFAICSFYSHGFGKLVKGRSVILIQNGQLIWDALKRSQVTEEDLRQAAREKLNESDLAKVKEARLERTGSISFIIFKK